MFFGKPIKNVSFQDVLEFCATKTKENEVLDYKVDFPKKLEKVIAAFANTYGGIIIIGVGDKDGIPEDDPKGINFERGLEERITSIIVSNISPVVFPEIQICPEVNGRTFILVQVPQSANTPHSIENRTKVYLRTGNITTPEKLANMDELHWLTKHREGSIWLRNDTINFVDGQFQVLCESNKVTLNFAEVCMRLVPEYPHHLPIDLAKLKEELVIKSVDTVGGSKFPYISRSQTHTMSGSIYLFNHNKNEFGEFTEYTAFHKIGLLTHVKDFGTITKNQDSNEIKSLQLPTILDEYYNFLRFYDCLRREFGIWGDYNVQVSFSKMKDILIAPINYNFAFETNPNFLRNNHSYGGLLYQKDFADKEAILKEVCDLAENLHWSFDIPVSRNTIEDWVKKRYQNIF